MKYLAILLLLFLVACDQKNSSFGCDKNYVNAKGEDTGECS